MKWKDITSRSRGEDPKTEPRTWESYGAPFRIVVTRHRDYDANTWLLRADDVGFEMLQLRAVSADDAKREAIDVITNRLRVWVRALEEFAP